MEYKFLPEQSEIERYIQQIYEQIDLACSVLINWNNLINKKKPTNIDEKTKFHLVEAIQTFYYAKNNLACVTNMYNYLFDRYPKEDNYGSGFVFDSMEFLHCDSCVRQAIRGEMNHIGNIFSSIPQLQFMHVCQLEENEINDLEYRVHLFCTVETIHASTFGDDALLQSLQEACTLFKRQFKKMYKVFEFRHLLWKYWKRVRKMVETMRKETDNNDQQEKRGRGKRRMEEEEGEIPSILDFRNVNQISPSPYQQDDENKEEENINDRMMEGELHEGNAAVNNNENNHRRESISEGEKNENEIESVNQQIDLIELDGDDEEDGDEINDDDDDDDEKDDDDEDYDIDQERKDFQKKSKALRLKGERARRVLAQQLRRKKRISMGLPPVQKRRRSDVCQLLENGPILADKRHTQGRDLFQSKSPLRRSLRNQ